MGIFKCYFVRRSRIRSATYCRKHKSKKFKDFSNYGIVLKMFLCLGINLCAKVFKRRGIFTNNIIWISSAILLHLAFVDYWLMSYANLKYRWDEYQVVISYNISNTLSLLLWYVLYTRKKSLTALLQKVDSIFSEIISVKEVEIALINFVILFCIIFLPLFYSCISLYLINKHDPGHYYTFYTYGHEIQNFTMGMNVYLFAKIFTSIMLDPMFIGTVTILYCIVCFRCYRLLSEYYNRLRIILHNDTTLLNNRSLQAIKDYTRIIRMLDQLQKVFSLPTFLLVLIDSTSSFTTLASVLLYSLEERTTLVTAENTFVFANSAFLLTATIGFASQIPIIIRRIRDCMQQLSENFFCYNHNCLPENSRTVHLRIIQERPAFVLSGCDIIYFTRRSILTALGTLFTYGLLIIQLK